MRDAYREASVFPHFLQNARLFAARQDKVDFLLHAAGTTDSIFFQRRIKLSVAIRRIVEIWDCLIQRICREVAQHALERTERQRALIKVLRRLGRLQADATLYKVISSPVFSFGIPKPEITRHGRDQTERTPGIIVLLSEEFRDCPDVLHQFRNVVKCLSVECLKDIASAGIRNDQKRTVDMPHAVFLTGNRLSLQHKLKNCLFHIHPLIPVSAMPSINCFWKIA